MRRLSSLAVAGATLVGSTVLLGVGPAHAVQADCTGVPDRTTPSAPVKGPSVPYDLLGMEPAAAAARSGPSGGQPVRVAVLDTGVQSADGQIPVETTQPIRTGDEGVVDGGGTEVAGLVAGVARDDDQGPVGFAPDAEIVDVRVGAVRLGDRDQEPATTDTVAQGLQWVADNAGPLHIKVATVAFTLATGGKALRRAVAAAQDAGVVVVAATGDPSGDAVPDTSDDGEPALPTDLADDNLLPAFDGVVAVNTTPAGTDGSFVPQLNSDTTVAAPSAGAVSYAINGQTCRVTVPSTSAATGEVAGVLALLWQRFPADEPEQIVARLVNTASGTTDDPTPTTGYGVVQPLDALTRPVDPKKDGSVDRAQPVPGQDGPVSPPSTPTDLLASTRDDAVWWALIGGGLVVVALLLRPVLARRR